MRVRFTPRALENIAAISGYLRDRDPRAAQRVRSAIYDSIQHLILFPYMGRSQNVPDVRRIITTKYSYLIYYSVDVTADEIVILNVKHPSREREFGDA